MIVVIFFISWFYDLHISESTYLSFTLLNKKRIQKMFSY